MKEVQVLWKKAEGDTISLNVWAKAKVRKWGHTTGLGSCIWAVVWSCFEPLLLSTTSAELWCASVHPTPESCRHVWPFGLANRALLLHWDFITHSIRIWKESILQLWTPVAYLLFIIVFIMVALNGPNIQRYHRVQPWREADEEEDPAYSNKMQKADGAMQKGFCVVSSSLPRLLVPRDVGDRVLVLRCSITIRRTYFQGSWNCKQLLPPLARDRF